MTVLRPSYGVRRIAASIISISLALTQFQAAAQDVEAPPLPTGQALKIFKPADGYMAARASKVPFCPSALQPESYEAPDKQLFQGSPGWLFREGEISWEDSFSSAFFRDLRRMRDVLARNGTTLMVVIPPPRVLLAHEHLPGNVSDAQTRTQFRAYLALLNKIRKTGSLTPDIVGEVIRHRIPMDKFTSPADLHWSPAGSWVTAMAITRQIAPNKLKAGVPALKGVFSLQRDDRSYLSTINGICQSSIPGTVITAFNPVEEDSEAGGDLLGASADIDIVLVGSSFSALTHRYSFAPFIQALSGRNVVNLAISGGGPLSSISQYLTSEDFKTSKPKYLIWEFTSSNIPEFNFASERRGLLRKACSSKYSKIKTAFRPGMNVLASAAQIAAAANGDDPVQLDVGSDNAAFKNFSVLLNYVDGRQDSIEMDSRRATQMEANYRLILPDDHALLSDISVVNQDDLTGSVTAQLCPADDPINAQTTSLSLLGRFTAWFKSFWS
ncbi:MAG: alginate O-acetyltransferase AlgX-related protein [Sphingobium sp.]